MINFFEENCREENIVYRQFGICDDQNSEVAYIDVDNNSKWIASVINPNSKPVCFTAIDNCIEIRRENGNMDLRCDGMIDYPDNIVFIELKNQHTGGWASDGLQQIESTILHYQHNHDLSLHKYKRAFVINKKRKHFQTIETELKRRFFDTYRVRISIGGEINIK